ncbi:TadE-like [Rhodoferax ferrireducens T118]|uniref:TadE-like n=1 Tax=Albidiferax ferrireducens (strain ATCC BAA-621 / DSM 15236 / T118) TaxID=338969 RepID=Q220K7_ALBFT|nr:TadE family protein [Rhodoferax ferrireducens]ABD68546.1 TadE-like [Rhodoferax ferrireducens T118]
MKKRTLRHSFQRGVAAVEFAILLQLVLVPMILGTTELGHAIYSFNTLDKTVRDAGRHLSQHGPGDATIAAEAKCLAVYGTTDCSGSPVAPGLTTAMVSICDASLCPGTHANQSTGLGSINLVTVSIPSYAFDSLFKFVIPNDFSFNNISVTLRAQL